MRVDEKTYKILDMLIKSPKPISGYEMAEEVGISRRSVQNYTKILKTLLKMKGYSLISQPGVGYFLDISKVTRENILDDLDFGLDYSCSSNYRKNYIFDRLFSSKDGYTIVHLAKDLYVSKSVIIKDLNELENWLKHFQVRIERRQNYGISFSGEELAIRRAYITNKFQMLPALPPISKQAVEIIPYLDSRVSCKYYEKFLQAFPNTPIQLIQEIISVAENDLNIRFTNNAYINIMEYIALLLKRNCFSPTIPNDVIKKEVLDSREYATAVKILNILLCSQKSNQFNKEVYYLAVLMIISERQYTLFENLAHYRQLDNQIKQSASKLIKHLGDLLNLPFVESEYLLVSVSLYIERMRFHAKHFIDFFPSLEEPLYLEDNYVTRACISSHGVFSKILGFDLNNKSLSYIAMLVSNAVAQNRGYIEGIYISPADYYVAQNEVQQIEAFIPELKIVDIIPHYQAVHMDFNELPKGKIFISTLPIPGKDFSKFFVRISDLTDESEAQAARRELLRLQIGRQGESKKKNNLINPNLINLNVRASNKFDAISFGCRLLRDAGYVGDLFESDVFQREALSSTALGQGIALPHGSLKHVIKSGISIIRLNKPVRWSEAENVDLIFILAFNFQNREHLRRESLKLYQFVSNPQAIAKIREVENKEELMDYIGVNE